MPRPRVLVGSLVSGALVAVVAVALGTWAFRSGGGTTPVPIADAVARFRETGPAGEGGTVAATGPDAGQAEPTQRLPAAGVYVYTTTGSDSVDALSGAEHTYPAETTVTVTAIPCGVTERWDVAVERWEERDLCAAPDGVATVRIVSYHRFFGQGTTDESTCDGDPRPAAAAAGATWATVCTQNGTPVQHVGRVVGVEPVEVAGELVDAQHVRIDIDDGDPADVQSLDRWYALDTNLLLVEVGASDTANGSPVGVVHYHERYEIRLDDTEPLH